MLETWQYRRDVRHYIDDLFDTFGPDPSKTILSATYGWGAGWKARVSDLQKAGYASHLAAGIIALECISGIIGRLSPAERQLTEFAFLNENTTDNPADHLLRIVDRMADFGGKELAELACEHILKEFAKAHVSLT